MVVTLIVVGTLLGLLRLTINTAGLPSTVVIFEMVTVGAASLSVMVPVPVAVVLLVLADVTFIDKVNVSVVSAVVSFVVGTVTVTLVAPAGMVTVVVVVV